MKVHAVSSTFVGSPPAARRWERIRCLGLSLTAVHWAIMVASEILVDGYEVDNGLDGPRCEFVFNTTVFQLKWAAQACHQIFQVTP